jgi:CDP-diacylglycerol--glycerol-3-phosphate 3-phosphatidyltransferase
MEIRFELDAIPWAMAAGRALLGPMTITGAKCGWNGATLAGIVVTALLSDIFDGVLARRCGCDSAAVRLFDSMSDMVFYLCVGTAIWIGHPQVWRANGGLLAALLGLEAARMAVEIARYGKPASYHSYLAKGIACNLEGLAMTLVLPVWRRDVKGLRAAWVLRTEILGARESPRRLSPVS